ncbi:MAG: hypothetical protein KDK62_02680 [Chlamydiia bacterium]|nr:hypothetical protein [Chlamydiia bacterium]
MLKKILVLVLVASSLTAQLPSEFYVKERIRSLTTTFDIESKEEVLGTVHRKIFSLMPEYHLKDPKGCMLAKARMRFWSLITVFDVVDENDFPIGSVNEQFSWFLPSFSIVSADAKKLANADLNFWGTKWTLKDPVTDRDIAVLSRAFFRLKNNWTVKIVDESKFHAKHIHPQLLMTLMAFQVDREYWEALSRNHNEKSQVSFKDVKAGMNQAFQKRLEPYRLELSEVEPTEEDYLFVEAYPETFQGISGDKLAEVLIDELKADHLTEGQKAALFIMLEDKFLRS